MNGSAQAFSIRSTPPSLPLSTRRSMATASLPARMEANPSRRISQLRAATAGGPRGVPVLGAARRPAQCGPDRSGASPRLRRAGRPAGDLRRGAARADRARDLSLRGSRAATGSQPSRRSTAWPRIARRRCPITRSTPQSPRSCATMQRIIGAASTASSPRPMIRSPSTKRRLFRS